MKIHFIHIILLLFLMMANVIFYVLFLVLISTLYLQTNDVSLLLLILFYSLFYQVIFSINLIKKHNKPFYTYLKLQNSYIKYSYQVMINILLLYQLNLIKFYPLFHLFFFNEYKMSKNIIQSLFNIHRFQLMA